MSGSAEEDRGLRSRSISGAKWLAVQKWYLKGAGLVTTLVLARILAPADFGLVAFAMAFVGVASVLTEAGFTPMLVQAKEVTTRLASTAFWVSVGFSLLLLGAVQVVALPVADAFGEPRLEPVLRVLALLMPITALSSVQTALLRRELRQRSLTLRQFVSTTVGAVAGIGVALTGGGVWALVAQTLAAAAAGVVVLWASTSWRPRVLLSMEEAGHLVRSGAAVLGTNLVHQVRDRGDEFLIGGILGAEVLGYWSIGTRLAKIAVDLFYSVVAGISFPVLSRVAQQRERFVRAVESAITLDLFLMLPSLVALAVLSGRIVPVLYGDQWAPTIPSAEIYTLAIAVGVFQWLDPQIWWAQGRYRTELWLSSLISLAHLLSVLVAAPFGLVAVATAILLRTAITAPVRLVVLLRSAPLPLGVYRSAPAVVLAVIGMVVAILSLEPFVAPLPPLLELAVLGAVAAGVYLGLSLLVQRRALGLVAGLLVPAGLRARVARVGHRSRTRRPSTS